MKETKKFTVKFKSLKLHGFRQRDNANEKDKSVAIEIKWKGPQKHALLSVPFYAKSSLQRNRTAQKLLAGTVEWDDEFQSLCEFPAANTSAGFWDATFHVLSGDSTKSKSKLKILGKISLNLAELVSNMETQVNRNFPIKDSVGPCQATLSVIVNFVEVRDCPGSAGVVRSSIEHDKDGFLRVLKDFTSFKKRNREKGCSNDGAISPDSVVSGVYDSVRWPVTEAGKDTVVSGLFPALEKERDQKQGKLSCKRRLSFRLSKGKVEPWIEKTCSTVNDVVTVDGQQDDKKLSPFPVASITASSQTPQEDGGGSWETKEIVSRDGKSKLKTDVFFGSFDQRSEKASGESACTTIVAVITHWLLSNNNTMPSQPQLNTLIMEGSSEWQKLCTNESYSNTFPNRHFDLETVVKADVRPISISPENSFVGFFSPEKFKCLDEAMSFNQIWNEINSKTAVNWNPRVYIVSWNDHFFVLKIDEDACYVVDSLGERLFEGCNQAYMLIFDRSSLMFKNTAEGEAEGLVCRGKECCREFFERFLAAITIEELEEEQKKLGASDFTPHQRLQIDFHFSSLVAPSSTNSSIFSDEDCSSLSSPKL